ncbi:MAG TPA: amphi-Trp domain-containing protein [Armatimonadota bacterium]|mgnify:FL=1|nr:amphi-Trp domain-containing protein [Armatimonadota bacterium]HOP80404.1 amphi-Trp domain-containing protein [Armatimonadota bacterium]HPP75607.1 amphi-Trp domain-containing protein [Armatimonadota bacterium]
MDPNEERGSGRIQLATRLHDLADMIERGSVNIGSETVTIPEDVRYELELEKEQKENKAEIEIELQLPASM